MYLLTGILMFVILLFAAACNWDYSGLAAIGKVIALFIGVMWLLTQPILLVVVIVILIIILIIIAMQGSSSK